MIIMMMTIDMKYVDDYDEGEYDSDDFLLSLT